MIEFGCSLFLLLRVSAIDCFAVLWNFKISVMKFLGGIVKKIVIVHLILAKVSSVLNKVFRQ